jgi:hypothetical protein
MALRWIAIGTLAFGCTTRSPAIRLAANGSTSRLAVDATHVYWIAEADAFTGHILYRVPKVGGPATALAEVALPATGPATALAVSSTGVYAATPLGVVSAPIDGGAPTVLASPGGVPGSLAIDSTNAYFLSQIGTECEAPSLALLKVPLAGGAATVLATGVKVGSPLAVDAANAYFVSVFWHSDCNLTTEFVNAIPSAGGTATTLSDPLVGWVDDFAIDGTSAYWIDNQYADGIEALYIVKRALAGGAPSILAVDEPPPPYSATPIAVDAKRVYWSDGASLRAVPTGGGGAVELVLFVGATYGIVADGDALYWNALDGVWKLPLD